MAGLRNAMNFYFNLVLSGFLPSVQNWIGSLLENGGDSLMKLVSIKQIFFFILMAALKKSLYSMSHAKLDIFF